MPPLLKEQREHPTPKIATTTKRPINNNDEIWGKQQQQKQQVHRHQYLNFFNENDHYCDPYHILHIRRDATKYEMKRSYQQLALLYHPTLTTTKMIQHKSACSQEQYKQERLFLFTLIAASYETLAVKEIRQRMDMILLQLQQQKNKKNQIQQPTSTMTAIKSEKHKITSPKSNGNKDDKNSSSNNIIISKAEYKIRKKLREERRVQQQRRRDDSNKKKQSSKNSKTKEPEQISQMKQNSVPPEIALSPSSSTTSSYNYHHYHHHRHGTTTQHTPSIDYDSAHSTDDSNNTHTKKNANSTTKTRKVKQSQDNIDISPKQKLRQHKKRGYHWAYVSSSCGCPNDDTTDNDIHKNDRIPFDEPFDRIDDYYCQGRTNTTTLPAVTVVHHRPNDNLINNNNLQPPSLVGSSDSEVNDDDNDSDYLLSLQNITKDFYSLNQPKSTTTTTNATERWFGGPLKLMYRARKFQPFTDPLVLFERTFRSGLLEQEQQRASTTPCNNDDDINNSIHKVVCLQPQSSIISLSTLATFSSNCNVVPISAADDTIETLSNGTIITRTHRTIPITTTNTEKQQEETIYKTVTRTITRYPPPDPSCHNNNNISHHRRMTVSVTSDVVVRVEQKPLLSSSTSFGNNKNHCVDCIGWMTCQSSENYYNATAMSNDDHNGHFSFTSMFQSWLPSC